MNFLQLTQQLRSEAGIAGNGPTTTLNQAGELGRLVSWINQAYEYIQDLRPDWNFLRSTFTFNCTISQNVYPTTTVTNLANWKPQSLRVYLNTPLNEWFLQYIPWEEFRDYRVFGAARTQTGRPIEFSITPAKELALWPIPDNTYTITGESYRTAHVLTADADTPLLTRFQMIIVFNALMRYASYVSEPTVYAYAQNEFNKLLAKLEREQVGKAKLGGPLA